ncbi:TlpA family protein disulfide reductase [Thermophagus sp. OGC60D27]|uniref:TlpA family protein disulfide reductase n=1 Tax=Thermophagus sp. OGC60D27 TaxID=3458415 RepID=UPI004038207E
MKKFWRKYSRKKRWWSIALDFLFMIFVFAMLFPGTRKPVSAFLIRQILFPPSETEKVMFLSENDWQMPLLKSETLKPVLLDKFKGKPMFVNFWATWCPPCIAEMPSIQKLYDDYKEKVAFILVSTEDCTTVNSFLAKSNYSFPAYCLAGGVPAIFETSTIPSSFIVSPGGRVVVHKTGAANWNSSKIRRLLDDMLKKE